MTRADRVSRRAIVELGVALRAMAAHADSMEEVARRMVNHLYVHLRDSQTGEPLCALVRLFKTHPFAQLPPPLQAFARSMAGAQPLSAHTPCLTLLASAGDAPDWNSRHTSAGHQAIPLTSEEMVMRSPMIAQLIIQFGLQPRDLLSPNADIILPTKSDVYDIFHVPQAVQSPYVPAQQEFVIPHGIASVVGFGGPLTGGNLYTVILFTKAPISVETASLFSSIALNVKLALLSLADTPLFDPEA